MKKETEYKTDYKKAYLKIYEDADKLIIQLSVLTFLVIQITGLIYGNFLLALFLATPHLCAIFLAGRFLKKRNIKTFVLGILFGLWVTYFAPAANGYFELSYSFFAFYIILITYQHRYLIIVGPLLGVLYNASVFISINFNVFKEFVVSNYKNEGFYHVEEFLWGTLLYIVIGIAVYYLVRLFSEKTDAEIENQIKLKAQLKTFERYKIFAEEIQNNNLSIDENVEKNDYIGKSLNNIKQKLSDAIKKEEKEKFLTNFKSNGIAKVSEILRHQDLSINELAYNLVSEIVKYVNADLGAIFIANNDLDNTKYLELAAAYAYERRKYIDKKILPGEGIIGTAFIENESVYMTKLPEGYLYLKSGLGHTKPQALIAQTISYNDETIGILEIASLNPMKKHELEFIETISEYIASSIISEKNKTETNRLLKKSNEITNEMRIKEQELNERIQVLEVENDELKRKPEILDNK